MRSQLIDILKDVAYSLKIIPSYSAVIPTAKKTELLGLINEVKQEVSVKAELTALLKDFYFRTADEYTTGTVAITTLTIACVGTDTVITAAMVGRKIRIGSDSSIYTIATWTDATHFTIDRPFLGDTETVGTIEILQDVYDVPVEVCKIVTLDPQDDRNIVFKQLSIQEMQGFFSKLYDYQSDPVYWTDKGSVENTETVTATAATTTTVTSATLTGDYDDYYVGWYLYNATRGKTVRVSDFVVATGVLTLEEAITGQVLTDTITLKQPTRRIELRYVPTLAIYVHGIGLSTPTRLVNDYDIENEIPEAYTDRVLKIGLTVKWKMNHGFSTDWKATDQQLLTEYYDLIEEIRRNQEVKADAVYQFGGGVETYPNMVNGSGWPQGDF